MARGASVFELEGLVPGNRDRSSRAFECDHNEGYIQRGRFPFRKVTAGAVALLVLGGALCSTGSWWPAHDAAISHGARPNSLVAVEDREVSPQPLMCNGMQSCGASQRQRWAQSPWSLADRVGGLDWLPGVNSDAYAMVLAAWRERPPQLPGGGVATLENLAAFFRGILTSDPFGMGDEVPYVDLHQAAGKVIGITQKQFAFIVANVLMGNDIPGTNGLTAALRRCTGPVSTGPASYQPYQPPAQDYVPASSTPSPLIDQSEQLHTMHDYVPASSTPSPLIDQSEQLHRMHERGWRWFAHHDIPDSNDAENIDGGDVVKAMQFAEQRGYYGFAVNLGRAWMKKLPAPPRKSDLKEMSPGNPVVFFTFDPRLGNQRMLTREAAMIANVTRRLSADEPRRLWWKPADIVFSLLSFMAVLSQEIGDGSHGSTLIAMAPGWDPSQKWKQMLKYAKLRPPNVFVKVEGHENWDAQPDFMTGGTPNQALTDIAGDVVGGGGRLCSTANTQDESLVQFYPEVLAFSFFMSGSRMLPVPFTILGARRYLSSIEGNSYGGKCGAVRNENWLNTEIVKDTVEVELGGRHVPVAASAFVAVKSECTGAHVNGKCQMSEMVNNQCDVQRRHVDADINYWIQAYNSAMYNPVVQPAFRAVIKRIGTGPWGAGEWHGDSQQYFLLVWLATTLLGPSLTLDYFIYDHFCENPGNQCFLLDEPSCGPCMARAGAAQPLNPEACGRQDIWGVVHAYAGRGAQELYDALVTVGKPPTQVFDLLAPVPGG